MRAPLAVAAAGLMSFGAIAAPGLHPLIAFVAYAAALLLVLIAGLARPPRISPGAAVITAVAAFIAALGMLAAGRLEVTPLLLVALVPLTAIGMALIRGDATDHPGPHVLALALLVALGDRQIFAPEIVGRDLVLAVAVSMLAVVVTQVGRWRLALYAVVLAAYAVSASAVLEVQPYRTDAVAATHGAAELVLEGRHPYGDFDMFERLERFGIPTAFATDLEDGTALRSLNYPALAFLIPAPLIAWGLDDVRLLYLVEVLLLLALVTISAREPWRPYVLAAGIGCLAVMRQYVVAGVDPAWALFLVMAWLTRGSRGSALLLGLAISARQTAWPIAPFLLLWTWRRYGRREALMRTGVAALVALVIHAPFLFTAPGAVLAGVTDVLTQPVKAGGVGPSFLGVSGLLPEIPWAAYFSGAAVGFALVIWAYARRALLARSALALPVVPLFLAYRSLQSYFALAPLLLLIDEGSAEET